MCALFQCLKELSSTRVPYRLQCQSNDPLCSRFYRLGNKAAAISLAQSLSLIVSKSQRVDTGAMNAPVYLMVLVIRDGLEAMGRIAHGSIT